MKKLLLIAICFMIVNEAKSQLNINIIKAEDWVKNNFAGQGVVLGNVSVKSTSNEAFGTFRSNSVLKIEEGLVMSTGDVRRIPSLNNKFNESTGFNISGDRERDADLEKIIKEKLMDVISIEFDFVPYNNSISFNYQFGSEEYPEYVGSAFNDIFAFIVSDSTSSKNIALIPKSNTPVSINSVNHTTNSAYYLDNNVFAVKSINRNDPNLYQSPAYERTAIGKLLYKIKKFFSPSNNEIETEQTMMEADIDLLNKVDQKLYQNLQFDGITTKLIAQTYVVPYRKYHLKIVIADVTDNIYDSGVFLENKSLVTVKDPKEPGFKDYPDYSTQINVKDILNGKSVNELLNPNKINQNHTNTHKVNLESPTIIYFDFDQKDPIGAELQKIYELARLLNADQENSFLINIIGHTDAKGSLNYNNILSSSRAISVNNCLKSITSKKLNTNISFKAYTKPTASNEYEEGRALNRRVEIQILKK